MKLYHSVIAMLLVVLTAACTHSSHPQAKATDKDSLTLRYSNEMLSLTNNMLARGDADGCVLTLDSICKHTPYINTHLKRDYLSIRAYALSRADREEEAEHDMLKALALPLYQSTHKRLFRDYAYAAAVFFSNTTLRDSVETWALRALDEAALSDNTSGAQYVRSLLGVFYKREGKLVESIDMLSKAVDEATMRSDTLGMVNAMNTLADVYLYWQVHDHADECATQALRLQHEYSGQPHEMILVQSYVTKAQTTQYYRQDTTLASALLDSAQAICHDMPYNNGMVDIDLQRGIMLTNDSTPARQLQGELLLLRVVDKGTPRNRAKAYMQLAYHYLDNAREAQTLQMLDSMYSIVHNEHMDLYIGVDYERILTHLAQQGDIGRLRQFIGMLSNEHRLNTSGKVNNVLAHTLADQQMQQERHERDIERMEERQHQQILVAGIVVAAILIVMLCVTYALRRRAWHLQRRLSEMHTAELMQTIAELYRQKEAAEHAISSPADAEQQEALKSPLPDTSRTLLEVPNLTKLDGELHFRREFERVYPYFIVNLRQKAPNIGSREELVCMLMILNQNTVQMADILGIAPASVRMSRHRIRKKLHITANDDLNSLIVQLTK